MTGCDKKNEWKKIVIEYDHRKKTESLIVPSLMFLGVIFATLCVIVAGYFHGHMDITKVWHSIHNFT